VNALGWDDVGEGFVSCSFQLYAVTMRNEIPVRQGEFGRRSEFLPFGVDRCTNQKSECSRTFLRRCHRIRTDYVVGTTTPRPKRRVTTSERASGALEAFQALPTSQSTAVRKRQRVSRDPKYNDLI
jgi:hypothetical protein